MAKGAAKKVKKAVKKIARKMGAVSKIKGRGGYISDLAKGAMKAATYSQDRTAVGKAARTIGESVGAIVHPAFSKVLGNAASWFTSLFGGGRYNLKRNSLLNAAYHQVRGRGNYQDLAYAPESRGGDSGFVTNSPPMFSTKGQNGSDVILAHREYIGDLSSSINFEATTYPINPGNPTMFPWLSQFASLYEEYEFLGLIFEFKTMSATAVGTTSSAMGNIIMATDYDCEDAEYTTKRQMEAQEYACSTVPFESFVHPVECSRKRNVLPELFTVPGITDSSQAPGDPRMSVMGNFTIATQGQQANGTAVGELWVSYHVRLSRPILDSSAPASSAYSAHYNCVLSTSGTQSTTASVSTSDSTRLSFTTTATSTTTATLAVGTPSSAGYGPYLISVRCIQSGTTAWATPATPQGVFTGGATLLNLGYTGVSAPVLNGTTARAIAADTATTWDGTNVCAVATYIVDLPNSDSGIAFPLYCQSNNATGVDVYVTSWNPGVITKSRRYHAKPGQSTDERLARLEKMLAGTSKDECVERPMLSLSIDEDDGEPISSSSSSSSSRPPGYNRPPEREDTPRYTKTNSRK